MAYGKNKCSDSDLTYRYLGTGYSGGVAYPNDAMRVNQDGNEIQFKSFLGQNGLSIVEGTHTLTFKVTSTLYDILGNTTASSQGKSMHVENVHGSNAGGLNLIGSSNDAAGTGMFVQKTTGFVGIGTVNPARPLQIETSQNEVARFINTQEGGDAAIGLRTTYGTDVNYAIGIKGSDDSLRIANSVNVGTNDRVTITSTGKVGLGVTDPDTLLEVYGTTAQQKWSYDADSFATMTVANASSTTLASGETGSITIDAGGDIVLDADSGVIQIKDGGTGIVNLYNSGASAVVIDAPGNIILDADGASVVYKDDGTESFRLTANGATSMALDAKGDIHLDADGGNVIFKDGGTSRIDFNIASPEITIYDDTNAADYFKITVGANGATTMASNDNDGLSGDIIIDADGDIILDADGSDVILKDAGSTFLTLQMTNSAAVFDAETDIILDPDGGNVKMRAANSVAAFDFDLSTSPSLKIMNQLDTGDYFKIDVAAAGATTISTVDDDGETANLTFDVDGDIVLDADGGNVTFKDGGTTIFDLVFNGANDFTVDAPGDIILDADGADVFLKDGGTTYASLSQVGGDLVVKSGSTPTTALTFDGAHVTVAGNLTVNGTTTTVNSTTITVDDKNMELGSVDTPSDTTADGGGLTLKGATDKTILWTNSTDAWHFNQGLNVTSGKIGIGLTDPDSFLEVYGTTTQQKWSYDADSFATMTVANASATTFATGESGNLTLDVGGNIELNADGGTITMADANATLFTFAANEIDVASGDLLLDVAGDIILDAAGDNVLIKDGGTTVLDITNSAANTSVIFDAPGNIILDADGGKIHFRDANVPHFTFDADNTRLTIWDDTASTDYLRFAVDTNGASTISTHDEDATAANLTLDVDGNIELNADGGTITMADAGSTLFTFAANEIDVPSGDLLLDVAGNIILDADGGTISLKDSGTTVLGIINSGASNIVFDAPGDITLDADGGEIYLKDAGTLKATFSMANSLEIDVPSGNLVLDVESNIHLNADGGTIAMQDSSANLFLFTANQIAVSSGALTFDVAGAINLDSSSASVVVKSGGTTVLDVTNSAASTSVIFDAPGNIILDADGGKIHFKDNNVPGAYIDAQNKRIGIGTNASSRALTIVSTDNDQIRLINSASGGGVSVLYRNAHGSDTNWIAGNNGADNFVVAKYSNFGTNDFLKVDTDGKIHIQKTASAGGYLLFGSTAGIRRSGTGTMQFKNSAGGAWMSMNSAGGGAVDTIANNTNNYILTATGDSTINGEANLTFDGTNLLVASTGKVAVGNTDTYIHQRADNVLCLGSDGTIELNADGASVLIMDDSTTILNITNSGANSVIFDTPGDIHLDADGGKVIIKDAGAQHFTFDSDNTQLTIWDDTNDADYLRFTVAANGASTISTNDADALLANLTLDVDGNIELNADGGTIEMKDNAATLFTFAANEIDVPSGDLALDVEGNIELNANGGNILMKDDAATLFTFAANEIDVASGDLLLDVPGDITLDADGGDIYFKDGGSAGMIFDVAKAKLHIAAGAHTGATSAGGYLLFGTSAGSPGLRLGSAGHIQFKTTHGGVWSKIYNSASGGGVSLANDGNNRVTTATGGGGINGEANLTFDGTNLLVASTGKVAVGNTDTYIHQRADNVLCLGSDGNIEIDAALDIELNADGSNVVIKDGSDTVVDITNSAGSTSVIFDAPGNIHLDADGGQVVIKDAGAPHFTFDADNTQFTVWDDTDAADYLRFTVAANGASTISTHDDVGASGHLTFDADGDIVLDADSGVWSFKDNGSMKLEIMTSSSPTILSHGPRLYLSNSASGARTIVDSHGGLITPTIAVDAKGMSQTQYGLSLVGSGGTFLGAQQIVSYNKTNSAGSPIVFKRTHGGYVPGGANTSAASVCIAEDVLGGMVFKGSDGAGNFKTFASIIAKADAGTSAGGQPGTIKIATTPAGAATGPTETITIMEDGLIVVHKDGTGGFKMPTATGANIDLASTMAITANGRSFKLSFTTDGSLDHDSRTGEITVSNSTILGADDLVIMQGNNGNTQGIVPLVYQVGTGSFKLKLLNLSGSQLANDSQLVYRGMVFTDGG